MTRRWPGIGALAALATWGCLPADLTYAQPDAGAPDADASGGGGAAGAGGADAGAGAGPPTVLAAIRLGGAQDDSAAAVALDLEGNLYVGGSFRGMADLGGGPVASAGDTDGFVASFAPTGAPRWALPIGGPGPDEVTGLAVDAQGRVLVTGSFSVTATLGAEDLVAAGEADGFVASLDPSGSVLWAIGVGGPGRDEAVAVSIAGAEAVVVCRFEADAAFGAVALTSAGGADAAVARLSPGDGSVIDAVRLGGPDEDLVSAVAADADGAALFAGGFTGTTNLGGADLAATPSAADGGTVAFQDAFAVRHDASGAHVWSTSWGGPFTDHATAAATSAGAAVIGGHFTGAMAPGGSPLVSAGGSDGFVVAVDAGGALRWAERIGDHGADQVAAVALDAQGRAHVAGTYAGAPAIGGSTLPAALQGAFLASYDGAGLVLRAIGLAGSDVARARAVAAAGGTIALAGEFTGAVGAGSETLVSSGVNDAFVVLLSP